MIIKNLQNFNYPKFIIIGGGPAGITLALDLEKKNLESLIIETGGLEVTEENQSRYNGSVSGDKYFDLDVTRLSLLGGSSNHWGGNCAPLDEVDFNNWPFKKNELDKYEHSAKFILDIKNDFIKYKKSDLDSFCLSTMQESPVNFKDKYLEHIKKSKKIFLLLNVNVERLISSDSKNVDQMIINSENGKEEIKFNDKTKFILCCGGIENSRILLWSRANSKNNFLKNLPIGNYWMEHPSGEIGQFIGEENKIKKLFQNKNFFLVPSNEFLDRHNLNNHRFSFLFWPTISKKTFKHKIKDLICLAPNLGKKIVENISSNIVHCVSTIVFSSEQKPEYNNKITLSNKERDNFGIPRVELNWNINEDVFRSLEISLEKLGQEFIKNNIGRVGIDKYVYEASFKNSREIFANHHHMGGTIMDNQTSTGVVNKELKVKNTNNFYILGSSVFPSGGHFNPTFTIVQLALRLSNLIQK